MGRQRKLPVKKKRKSDEVVYKGDDSLCSELDMQESDIDECEESSDNDESTSDEEIGEAVAKVVPDNWVRRDPCTKKLRTWQLLDVVYSTGYSRI